MGKPATRRFEAGGGVSFHHHEIVGAKLVAKRLKALRYDKETIAAVAKLVELHLRFHGYGTGEWTDSAVRRYITDAGPLLPRLHLLTRSDSTTRNARKAQRLARTYDDLEARIETLKAAEELAAVRPELDGNEIGELLGVPPGRVIGDAYKFLLGVRLDEGMVGKDVARERLLAWWAERNALSGGVLGTRHTGGTPRHLRGGAPMRTTGGVVAALATDVGRVRAHNEDAGLVTPDLVAVADGMGGHAAGEVASGLAVEALRSVGGTGELRPKDVLDAVTAANDAILRSAAQHPQQNGMATTLAGLARVTVGGSPHWAAVNIGDSRIYRVVDGRLAQVSKDHSEVAELVTLGLLTPEEALVHPARNIVTRCLGRDPLEPVDSWVFPPHPGERFLLCTDGLTNELRDTAIARILGDGDDPQAIADALVAAAVEAGGRDNVTVVVVLGSPASDAAPEADEETAPRNGGSEDDA